MYPITFVLNKWHYFFDNNIDIDVIYTDFAKAFDTVFHPKLLAVLHSYGVSNDVIKLYWLKQYLNNRLQSVCINNAQSTFLNVTSGVLLSSVLGSLLFNIYINDLVNSCVSVTACSDIFAC